VLRVGRTKGWCRLHGAISVIDTFARQAASPSSSRAAMTEISSDGSRTGSASPATPRHGHPTSLCGGHDAPGNRRARPGDGQGSSGPSRTRSTRRSVRSARASSPWRPTNTPGSSRDPRPRARDRRSGRSRTPHHLRWTDRHGIDAEAVPDVRSCEALSNAVRHAQATSVEVARFVDRRIELRSVTTASASTRRRTTQRAREPCSPRRSLGRRVRVDSRAGAGRRVSRVPAATGD
jgi:hypothetical protein